MPNANIMGIITGPPGTGLSGATVSCAGRSTTSLSDGSYVLTIPMSSPSTTCTLSAAKSPPFLTSSVTVSLNSGLTTNQNLQLLFNCPLYGAINGFQAQPTELCIWYNRSLFGDSENTNPANPGGCTAPHPINNPPGVCNVTGGIWNYPVSGWGSDTFTLPPYYTNVYLFHAGFDGSGEIYVNGNLVHTETFWMASEYDITPPFLLNPYVHVGTNDISAHVNDCCCCNMQAIAYIAYN